MKSLLLTKERKLEMVDVPRPSPGPDEVLIRVAACGICGSDVHGYDGSSGRRIPPLIMGHEASGIISELGSAITGFKVGERVTFDSTIYCGECIFCRAGQINLCEIRQVIGVSCADFHRQGAFAEFVVVPGQIVYRLPDNMPFSQAAMIEAVSVALHAVRVSGLSKNQSALVIGAGMIGLLTLQAIWSTGCDKVAISDVDATRLRIAERLGAHVISAGDPDHSRQIAEMFDGLGPDIVFEAVGRNETISSALHAVRKGGTVTLIGNVSPEVSFPLQRVVTRELRVLGSAASSGEYPQAIELVASGRIQVEPLISAIAPLEEGPAWFERLYAREPNLMKVVLSADTLD